MEMANAMNQNFFVCFENWLLNIYQHMSHCVTATSLGQSYVVPS